MLISTNGKIWNYLEVPRLSTLVRKVTLNCNKGFYYLNCLHAFQTKAVRDTHKEVYIDHNFCQIEILIEEKRYSIRLILTKIQLVFFSVFIKFSRRSDCMVKSSEMVENHFD